MYDAKSRDRLRADEKRNVLSEYKIRVGCADCGYNDNPAALEFDHLPGKEKTRTVASLVYHSWEKIWSEVAKCEVVCSNCHSIRTIERLKL